MPDHAALYRQTRERIVDLVSDVDDTTADQVAPATPEWRIRDILAHVVGVNADVLAGNIEGAGTDPWTAVQVASRQDRTLGELLAEWQELADSFDAVVPHIPDGPAGQLIFDVVTHEHDLRGALGAPGGREGEAMDVAFGWASDVVALLREGESAGALELRTEHGDRVAGGGEPVAAVRADRFELFRAMTGRRSREQIEAFEWSGDPDARRPFPFFRPRPTALVE